MSHPYQPHQIHEILLQPKCLPQGSTLEIKKTGKERKSAELEMRPVLIDGGFLDMRYFGKAARIDEPATYDAAFLIANHRVRGVGYCAIARNNFRFKKRIPQGWHLNVCDPNLPTHDERQNIHQPLDGFDPKDYRDFINQTTQLWKIDLGWEWEGDLFS